MNGGYDDGYRECQCFWGLEPGSYVKLLCNQLPSAVGLKVLDAGCGEGKNAAFLADRGATVEAIDVSDQALQNGRRFWNGQSGIQWRCADIRHISLPSGSYDIVVAYGLLHCLPSIGELRKVLARLQDATRTLGYNVICAFNDRHQELHAHPGFSPSLLSHPEYLGYYSTGWEVIAESDLDLVEKHPHNKIEHRHSMTRILARKVQL
jgi:SAM-dependent methyltransferase